MIFLPLEVANGPSEFKYKNANNKLAATLARLIV
jgi:hypothetical protein